MEYINFKSKKFGDIQINLTEAIDGKSVKLCLNEEVTDEYKKNLPAIKKEIEAVVTKSLGSDALESKVSEIVVNCLTQFYKQLYNKRSIWLAGIKK